MSLLFCFETYRPFWRLLAGQAAAKIARLIRRSGPPRMVAGLAWSMTKRAAPSFELDCR